MWYQLNCYGYEAKARRMKDGALKYLCPFCEQPTKLLPRFVAFSENHVRTRKRVWCPYPDCDVPYEIKHSNFVAEEDEKGHPLYRVAARNRQRRIHRVWRTHNER